MSRFSLMGDSAQGRQIMDLFFLDVKYAARSMWRAKGFALTVLLTLSVCIAANTALFRDREIRSS